jgi:predicted nucleotidyltransferase
MIRVRNIPPQLRKQGLKEQLLKICRENDVVFMAIFGSFVRQEERKNSDIDIAIKFKKGAGKSLFDLIELEGKLRKLFRRKVDLGEYDTISPYIMDYVKKEMRVIYEKG